MNIAISVTGETLDSAFDARFGRAPRFCVVDTDSGASTALNNPAIEAASGAGVRAAQFLAEHGVSAVVSGAYGPKAWITLNAAGIDALVAAADQPLTGVQVLDQFRAGALTTAHQPSHEGHRGG